MDKDVYLEKKPDDFVKDMLVLRASIGGNEASGFYCLFRGPQEKVIAMLEKVVADMKKADPDKIPLGDDG